MGTNYYLQRKVNSDGRIKDIHICKLSNGWAPSFQGCEKDYNGEFPEIKSWFDWKMYIKKCIDNDDGFIFNEYDEVVDFKEFIKTIDDWSVGMDAEHLKNHAEEAIKGAFGGIYSGTEEIEMEYRNKNYWVDPEGHSFSLEEFS